MQPDKPLIIKIDPHRPDKDAVKQAAAVLREGGLVLLPTDTVYGVAAGARQAESVARLCKAKGRDAGKPIPLLIDHPRRLKALKADWGKYGRRLADEFWPGPLTLVLRAGHVFEGFRVPDHRVTLAVLRAAGGVARITSANQSGEPPARSAEEAAAALGQCVQLILDAGPAPLGLPSTVVKIDGAEIEIIREGAIPAARIHEAAEDRMVLFVCSGNACRSPMAEYLLRDWLGRDSRWTVRSAGTSALDDLPATREAIDVMRERKIDMTRHLSRHVTSELVDAASAIVVMTAAHRATIEERFPDARRKTFLLKSFSLEGRGEDVDDPIGLSVDAYRRTRNEIEAALPDLVLYLHGRDPKTKKDRKGSG